MKNLITLFTLFLSFVLYAQEELVLPYDATSLTDEQRAMNPTYLAYPTSIAEQMPLQICGTDYTPMPFTINADGDQVYFSPGNLQYQASTKKWRFAEHQWDYVGDETYGNVYENGVKCDNSKISSSYNGWIDLFGWGTSGWNSGAVCYQPWSTSGYNDDYIPGNSGSNNLSGTYARADWGIYNKIQNGSSADPAGTWRTLSKSEWNYLLHERKDAALLFGLAIVNNVFGLIVLPDDFILPTGLTFTHYTTNGSVYSKYDSSFTYDDSYGYFADDNQNNYENNRYTIGEWKKMEIGGAVFLPCCRYRIGNSIIFPEYTINYAVGCYWSSSARYYYVSYSSVYLSGVYSMEFHNSRIYTINSGNDRSSGKSVRLIRES